MNSNSRRVIGISGYMGSGKSTAALQCANLGAHVVDVDQEAKRLMIADRDIRGRIAAAFGDDIVANADINFEALGQRVYASREFMHELNRIVHPLLLHELAQVLHAQKPGLCVVDAALISYWHIEDWFDVLVWIDAPFEMRLDRVCAKTRLGREDARRRMDMQEHLFGVPPSPPWEVVRNTGPVEVLARQIAVLSNPDNML